MNKLKSNKLVAILFPVVLILGIALLTEAIPKGELLEASTEETTLFKIANDGKDITDLKSEESTANLQIIAKETGVYELSFDGEGQVSFPNITNEKIPYFESMSNDFDKTLLDMNVATSESTSIVDSSKVADRSVLESAIYKVTDDTDQSKGVYYFKLVKDQRLSIGLSRLSNKARSFVISNYNEKTQQQTLIEFVNTEKKETSASELPKTDTLDGKQVLQAVTKPTDKSLEELKKTNFQPEDSLISPYLLTSAKLSAVNASSSDIVAVMGDVEVLDGKAQWDSDNNPGHDENESNGIVRSWDQITYLVSFAIQNTNNEVKYRNIKYQVTGTLPNAVQLSSDGKTPQVNGMIANGTMYNNSDNQPNSNATEGYSEGIFESAISNSGQVVAPVIVNVMGAPNGQTLKPTFKLKVISAEKVNEDGTIEEVSFDDEYDDTDFPNFSPDATKVSSKPSVSVKLVKGKTFIGDEAAELTGDPINNNKGLQAWNTGVETVLQPLTEHSSFSNAFVGSGYPKTISYNIKYSGTYSDYNSVSFPLDNTAPYISIRAYAPAVKDRTLPFSTLSDFSSGKGITNSSLLTGTLQIPHANTNLIYSNTPNSNTDLSRVGVYNSGDFTVKNNMEENTYHGTNTVTNNNFAPVFNPYTYDMTGGVSKFLSDKPFSSLELVSRWNAEQVLALAISKNWSSYNIHQYIDELIVDGNKVTQSETSLDYGYQLKPDGYWDGSQIAVYPIKTDFADEAISSKGNVPAGLFSFNNSIGFSLSGNNAPGDSVGAVSRNFGDNVIAPGRTIYVGTRSNSLISSSGGPETRGAKAIFSWNPSAFSYNTDLPVGVYLGAENAGDPNSANIKNYEVEFGVAINPNQTPPVAMKQGDLTSTGALYTWYTDTKSLPSGSAISAVRITAQSNHGLDKTSEIPGNPGVCFTIPLDISSKLKNTANAPGGYGYPSSPLVTMSNYGYTDADGKIVWEVSKDIPETNYWQNGSYKPTQWSDTGAPTIPSGQAYYNINGNSYYVNGFNIITKTDVKEPVYDIDDTLDVKIQGYLYGDNTNKYDGAIKTTLQPGIIYTPGSAVDGQGNPLPDPVITTTGSGSNLKQILTWSISSTDSDVAIPNVDMSTGSGLAEVNFKATSDLYILNQSPGFTSEGTTKSNLIINTIGTMWETGDTDNNDDSLDAARSSSDVFNEKLDQQVPFIKMGDKSAIDVGNVDPAQSDAGVSMNDITYELTSMYNALPKNDDVLKTDINMLDVLPYNGDDRGTKLTGGYTVQSVKVSMTDSQGNSLATAPSGVTMAYSTEIPGTSYTIKSDPNTVTGFVESNTIPAETKALLIKATGVPVGAVIKATIVLRPNNKQKASDIFVNSASMNSSINKMVDSEYVKTKVYGRDLSGVAWYDDDSNGLIDTAEPFVKDIPVKLYRTSLDDENYKNELVKESLTGEKFVDDSGDSLIKTDANGKYLFSNLAEGEYIAEFVVGDQVVQKKFSVTKPLVGDDPTLNSKADQDTFKTAKYTQPELSNLTMDKTLSDATYHITDVNIGLIRLSNSTIRLFKYEAGSATDADSDGSLSDTEKSTGTPLAGATFDLYKGSDQTEKVGTATTDANGYLNFTNLASGTYNLVETQAPEGYELMKTPIKVTITEANQTVMVYQDNEKTTELPHAGGNGPMVWLLGIVSALGLAGFGAVYRYYRQPREKGA